MPSCSIHCSCNDVNNAWVIHEHNAEWYVIYIVHAGFHGLPSHAGRRGLEGGTDVGVRSLGSSVPTLESFCPASKVRGVWSKKAR